MGRSFELVFLHGQRLVEKKVRQRLMRARGRKGFGWKRWSSEWLPVREIRTLGAMRRGLETGSRLG